MPVHPASRREFLSTAAATAGMAIAAPHIASAAADSPKDLRVAVIGVKGRGRTHIGCLSEHVTTLCDVDSRVLAGAAADFEKKHGRKVDTETDFRQLLQRKDIDAVSIATPNHTHTLIAIEAMKAGKDVYCEKPVSHNVWEGQQLVAAARKYGRIIQSGTQSRSATCLQQAVAYVQSGELGKIEYALGTCYKPRKPIGKLKQPLSIPDSIDYDLWCGPADKVDLFRPHLHYDWHWDYNTGAGDMGNQGIHQMDICRWFLGEHALAPRTLSIGARLGYDDAADTANTQVVLHDYEKAPILFETRGLPRSKAAQANWGSGMDVFRGSRIGVIVQCEGGMVYSPEGYSDVYAWDAVGKQVQHWRSKDATGRHFANFVSAVAAQDAGRLNAEINEGHLSSALCHVGNVSHQLGKKTRAGDIADELRPNERLATSFDRMASHLRANDVEIDREPALVLGEWVEVDPQAESAAGAAAQQSLWKREGRQGFRVPQLG